MLISQLSFEKTFGLSSVFIESTLMENGGVPESANSPTLIKEAIHVIGCGYEEKTEWGKEVKLPPLLLNDSSVPCLFNLTKIKTISLNKTHVILHPIPSMDNKIPLSSVLDYFFCYFASKPGLCKAF
jgi:hypothetical protein